MKAPVLRLPNLGEPFEVHSDASLHTLGVVLVQRSSDGVPHAITYWSRVLKEAQTRHSVIDLEALALVEAVRPFDPYIYGHFTAWTDHQPLTHVFSRRTKSNRLSRYAHELGNYDFTLYYKQGASNHVPDHLSRPAGTPTPPDEACPVEQLPLPGPPEQLEVDHGIPTLEPRQMREQQLRDPTCRDLLTWLEGRQTLPQRRPPAIISSFEVEGVLYHLREFSDRVVRQVYVPRHLQQQALHFAHCPPAATHPGALLTYQNLCNASSWRG